MKTKIEVENRKEAALIAAGLKDKPTRALVKVMGALATLPSDRARVRTLRHVTDVLNEHEYLLSTGEIT